MRDLIVQLDAKSFPAALKRRLVLVDFWEPWCGPCQIQQPVLEEVARRVARRATIARVNVDEAQKLAAHYGILSIPTLVLFKHGKVVRQFVGSHSSAALVSAIEEVAGNRRTIPNPSLPVKAHLRKARPEATSKAGP